MFIRSYLTVLVVLSILYRGAFANNNKKERMRISTYFNPKYTNVSKVIKSSDNNGISFNVTTFQAFGDNATVSLIYQHLSLKHLRFKISRLLCAGLKLRWAVLWLETFTDILTRKCPFPAGIYKFMDLRVPLSMLPILATKDMDNNYDIDLIMSTTETKEVVAQFTFIQRYR